MVENIKGWCCNPGNQAANICLVLFQSEANIFGNI